MTQKYCEHHSLKTNEGNVTQFFTDVFRFIDVLVRFWGQRSQQAMTRKTDEYNICVTIGANLTKLRSHMYLGLHGDIPIRFSGEKVKVQGQSRRSHSG